ncbi:unnamed protein product [Calicophoron daubneyi]|uniref:Secreted protein n=1 Tax=Calicophoron daubneyi TaxID=300641 RepID=A0AAV2TYU8_CALDB
MFQHPILFSLLFIVLSLVKTQPLSLTLLPNGIDAAWRKPPEPLVEYLLLWQRVDNNRVEGHRFLRADRTHHIIHPKNNCTTYRVTLFGFDYWYRQHTLSSKKILTGWCTTEDERFQLSLL